MKNVTKTMSVLMAGILLLAGCGNNNPAETQGQAAADTAAAQNTTAEGKTLTFGCQMYSDGLINPASQTNCAWNCMRFGVSEALFKFNDNIRPVHT